MHFSILGIWSHHRLCCLFRGNVWIWGWLGAVRGMRFVRKLGLGLWGIGPMCQGMGISICRMLLSSQAYEYV